MNNDRHTGQLFAGLYNSLSCLGLLACSLYGTKSQLKKLVCARFRCTVAGVTTMLSKDFLKLVMLLFNCHASILVGKHKWLQGYSYRISISVWVFSNCSIYNSLDISYYSKLPGNKAALATR